MKHVVFVAPFVIATTLRFIRSVASLDGARVSLITQDPAEKLPEDLRAAAVGHWRVADGLDAAEIELGVRALAKAVGGVDCLVGTLEQLQVPLAQVRAKLGLKGLTVAAAENFRDKARMKTALRNAGLPCAKHKLVADRAAAFKFAEEVGYPIVVKPPAGVGSKGTHRVTDAANLATTLASLAPAPERPLQAEEFVTGEENTLEAVTIAGKPVWYSGTRYLPGPLTVLENPWMQYCVLLPREEHEREFAEFSATSFAAVKALGIDTGLTHMEWFKRPDGSAVISEVGARPPGVHIMPLMALAHGFDTIAAWVRLMVKGTFSAPPRTRAAGVACIRAQGTGTRIASVHGVASSLAAVAPLVAEVSLPRVGQTRAEGYEGEGHVILAHPRTETVVEGLRTLVRGIRVVLG